MPEGTIRIEFRLPARSQAPGLGKAFAIARNVAFAAALADGLPRHGRRAVRRAFQDDPGIRQLPVLVHTDPEADIFKAVRILHLADKALHGCWRNRHGAHVHAAPMCKPRMLGQQEGLEIFPDQVVPGFRQDHEDIGAIEIEPDLLAVGKARRAGLFLACEFREIHLTDIGVEEHARNPAIPAHQTVRCPEGLDEGCLRNRRVWGLGRACRIPRNILQGGDQLHAEVVDAVLDFLGCPTGEEIAERGALLLRLRHFISRQAGKTATEGPLRRTAI